MSTFVLNGNGTQWAFGSLTGHTKIYLASPTRKHQLATSARVAGEFAIDQAREGCRQKYRSLPFQVWRGSAAPERLGGSMVWHDAEHHFDVPSLLRDVLMRPTPSLSQLPSAIVSLVPSMRTLHPQY